ncbi:hypothetical protein Cch01nite_09340 [Cellulomonas chitinilytica]|uniref:Uncharacterized protein n=1 Tax=Cellulomonas chitinilytica TaxID=398759 RepID=A0A919TY48_9CELL|nr:hypothetical protein [Cellulomonas chitinilytica]GIG20210.1 hypothetical protein Cch01nite_09340 [Cellulomonas chitinilytica]
MTALATRPTTAPGRRSALRTLAGLEARRYALHPLFVAGVLLLTVFTVQAAYDLATGTIEPTWFGGGDLVVMPAFFLGMVGVLVANQLTRSLSRSAEAVAPSPADGLTRTAALCLACLVPGAAAVVWLTWTFVAQTLWTIPPTSVPPADTVAILCAGVVCAVGGPLLGVLVGRWTAVPGAGILTFVLLYAWVGVASIGGSTMAASHLSNLVSLATPFTLWTSGGAGAAFMGGSPGWYLLFLTTLCGLAAAAALWHEARGASRARLGRTLVVLGLLAAAGLLLAAAADPARIPL